MTANAIGRTAFDASSARGVGEEECIDESPSARHGGSYSHSIIVSPAQLAIPVGGGTTATTMMSGVMVLLLLLLLTLLSTRRRARIVACSMRDDINRAWRGDGRPMLDCSDVDFRSSVLNGAIERGRTTISSILDGVETSNTTMTTTRCDDASVRMYDMSSSVMDDDESIDDMDATRSNSTNTKRSITKLADTTKFMSKQVGGIAKHKSPVLSFMDRYVLKPLRLEDGEYDDAHEDAKDEYRRMSSRRGGAVEMDGKEGAEVTEDDTKKYRGLREVAFYEAMHFTMTMPSDQGIRQKGEDIASSSRVSPNTAQDDRNNNYGRRACGGVSSRDGHHRQRRRRRFALRHLLSLTEEDGFTDVDVQYHHELSFRTTASLIRICRNPCTGHHHRIGSRRRRGEPRTAAHARDASSMSDLCRYYLDYASLHAWYYWAGDCDVVRAVQAYEMTWNGLIDELGSLRLLRPFTSSYFGVVDSEAMGRDDVDDSSRHSSDTPPRRRSLMRRPHLMLQNLTTPFSQPNIIDIKMGTRTFEPTAPLSKQISEAAKYPQQVEFGFRIVGMAVHSDDGKYNYWDKSFGVGLKSRDDVTKALATFFLCDEAARGGTGTCRVLSRVIEQLTQICDWFEKENSSLSFYASSILIAYEGSCHDENITRQTSNDPVVKMIDFAHVCRQTGADEGYLKGIHNLLDILYAIKENNRLI